MSMKLSGLLKTTSQLRLVVSALFLAGFGSIPSSVCAQPRPAALPKTALLSIVRAEDERRWDQVLEGLLSHSDPGVRRRAALAAGRIGNELSVPALVSLLQNDKDRSVRSLAAFSLGEVESSKALEALTSELSKGDAPRARIVEALGKIAAALPQTSEVQKKEIGKTILDILTFEARRRSRPDSEVILQALTATLRARPEGAGPIVAEFLSYSDPRIRSDAGNTLARLRSADGNAELRKLLTNDSDPNVRANAARVLGATEDKAAFDGLLDRAWKDPDKRVRISAIRAVAALKDARAADRLLQIQLAGHDELLELATAVGRLLVGTENPAAIEWLRHTRASVGAAAEIETALVRIAPMKYLDEIGSAEAGKRKVQELILTDWRAAASTSQALGEFAALPDSQKNKTDLSTTAQELLRAMLDYRNSPVKPNTLLAVHSEYAVPDVLRALSAFKAADLDSLYRGYLKESDVVVRTTAAELLGELPQNSSNTEALGAALTVALRDKESNDAALAILDTLAKYKTPSANQAIMTALDSRDYIVRRKAIEALKATGAGDFSNKLREVGSRNTARDYERAISRIGKRVRAVVNTNKGGFTIELLPAEAPLNVDNFVQLAKRGYFNKIVFHRVVPNFVVQGGDPRGDGNGGPGYQIRCEINEVPYRRGAVGMALSGKDTGGSQWFVTHAPQPHLDGGYTVFGNVIAGMEVVDTIVRGDVIKSIAVTERPAPKMQTVPVDILEN
jgi:cyclophilin family peptidyl-prolyl cis-trans isomerase/HEAT repeat protein